MHGGCGPGLVLIVGRLQYGQPPLLPPSPSPSPGRYWELGERARAQPASKITPCSTHCLRVQPSGGRGQGPCNVTLRCQKNQDYSEKCESTSSQRTRPLEPTVRCSDICNGLVQMPFLDSFLITLHVVCHM